MWKVLFFILVGVLACLLVVAQPPVALAADNVIEWTRQFGTASDDRAYGVATYGGNVHVVGETDGALPNGGGPLGSSDAFVRRWASGPVGVSWTRQFGANISDAAYGVATDPAGNVYVAGETGGVLPDGGGSQGGTDAFVRKYDLVGNIRWTRQFGRSRNDVANAAAVDVDGNVYVAGGTKGEVLSGGEEFSEDDAYVRKYDSSGNVLWTRQFGGSDDDEVAEAVTTDASGKVYVAGNTSGALPGGGGSQGGIDAYVRKYDSSGDILWTRQFGTTGNDLALTAATDASGNIFVAGHTDGGLPGGGGSQGLSDAFVRKYEPSGNIVWTRQFGTIGFDRVQGATTDTTGNIYVAGATSKALPGGGWDDGDPNFYDAFVRKYSPSGNINWTRQFGTAEQDKAHGTATDPAGNVYVTGYTGGALPNGGGSQGLEDAFVMKFGYEPDLVVESIVTDPASPAPGETVDVTVTVRNQGAADAIGAFYVDFYKDRASAPPTSQRGDFAHIVTSLAAGATHDSAGSVSYPAGGTYQMWAQVDTDEEIAESDETNNAFGPQDIIVGPILTVTLAGTGSGTVTSNPAGIDCEPDCSERYVPDTPVDVTPTPDPGATFTGWSGDADCLDGQVTMDADKSCTVTFDDTAAPSTPQNLVAIPKDVDTVLLSWDAATDTGGSGVRGYRVYDTKTGALAGDKGGTNLRLPPLGPGDYSYFVKAYDGAGNVSDRSRFAAFRLPVSFAWQSVDISGKTFAANPAGATAKASFAFEGEEVTIDYGCGLNTGIFEVSIDGAVIDTVDAYCSTPDFNAQKTYATGPGGHTIEVRPTGNNNASSSYYWTLLDSFEVAGETYEEDDGILYTWQTVDISGATFSANPAGSTASASFTFVGAEGLDIAINYGCGLNTGIFDVEIDGKVVDTVDAYCATPDFSARKAYDSDPQDVHTITVRPTGDKNPSSSYYWTLIDSFDVSGSIYQAQALPRPEAEGLSVPESRLSKLFQRFPEPLREKIEKRLEQAGGIASAETISLLNSEKIGRLLERLGGKTPERR